MSNLVIGNTSQLSYYFPNDYDKISSRNIDYDYVRGRKYDTIFISFAEQRTFLKESEEFFSIINVTYTLEVIDKLKEYCGKIVVFSTAELWNNYEGKVSISMDFNFNYSPYIKSKEILSNTINENRDNYKNVIIVYPFNFNSPYRKEGFLFNKIFNSIKNKKKIIIGNINFSRDIIHPSIIVENSIEAKTDLLIGSGELFNIEKFVKDLYYIYNLNFDDYISFNIGNNLTNERKDYYSLIKYSNYNELLKLTINDLRKNSIS
jgi:nucleoside-diphosphate-sugar epimerase